MKKLRFKDEGEFSKLFQEKSPEIAMAIMEGIKEALMYQKKSADLFELEFEGHDFVYDIALPKSDWKVALEHCKEKFRLWEMADEAIDAHLLIKEIDLW